MITLDTIPKLIIAALTIVASVSLIVFPLVGLLRWFFSRGGRASLKGASAGIGDDGTAQVLAKLAEMNEERTAAREQAAEKEKNNERRWRKNFTILDAMAASMLSNGIGNGELTKARGLIAECKDDQVEQLIEQGGAT